jgi:hypothetical protein
MTWGCRPFCAVGALQPDSFLSTAAFHWPRRQDQGCGRKLALVHSESTGSPSLGSECPRVRRVQVEAQARDSQVTLVSDCLITCASVRLVSAPLQAFPDSPSGSGERHTQLSNREEEIR